MPRRKTIISHDLQTTTLEELSKNHGISYSTLARRYQRGVRGSELLKEGRICDSRSTTVLIGSEKLTLAEVARRAGLKYSTVYQRYRRGLRGADLLGADMRRQPNLTDPTPAPVHIPAGWTKS